ncbi:MAG: apolipoprotein N-acyltransferase [Desulfomonilia bacterium]
MRALLLAILAGLLYAFSFPSFGLWYCAWVFAVPLFLAVDGKTSREAVFYGLISGLIAWAGTLYWIAYVMDFYGGMSLFPASILLFLLLAYLSVYFGIFAWASRMLGRSRYAFILLPGVWIFLELIRSYLVFSGFPWALVGHSQLPFTSLVQVAEIGGVYLISGMVVMGNVALYQMLRRKYLAGAVTVCLVILACAWGHWRVQVQYPTARSDVLKAAVAQANIPQDEKWRPETVTPTIDTYIRLTEDAESQGAELVVWPETACPFYLFRNWELTTRILDLSKKVEADLLVGSPAFEGDKFYNRVWLLRKGSIEGFYDKVHLVPFGEYLPFADILEPVFGNLTQGVGDFSAAGMIHPIEDIGVLICFESIFPDLSRQVCRAGATYLVNVSNDAWFRTWSTPEQHLQMAAFRAIETRRWLLRSVNHGISAIVDPYGRIVSRIDLLEEGVIMEDIAKRTDLTFHTRFGPVICWIWALFSGIAALTSSLLGVKA